MAFMAAGGDPSTNQQQAGGPALQNTGKGDLRTKAHFSKRSRGKAKKHWLRKTLQPCGTTRPLHPDPTNIENQKYIKAREKAARKKAWHMAKNLNKAMGTFQDMDKQFFKNMDPEKNSMQEPKPTALYAATRSFVIDSGASYHLIGYKQLTEKEKGSIRPIKEPLRIQSANGIIIVDKEVHIFVPALNVSVWAQLMQDCPAVLPLGILCSRQGWTYEWQNSKNPTLSKGSRRITLTPRHDVPMVFAARIEQVETDLDDAEPAGSSAAAGSSEGRPSAIEEEERTSDSAREGRPSASSGGDEPTAANRPKAKSKGGQRQKQRIVKSKYSVPASARNNKYTHFPLDMNCEICKLVKRTRAPAKQEQF